MDYSRNAKYFEKSSIKSYVIMVVIGALILLGGMSSNSFGTAIFGLAIAGLGGFLIFGKKGGRPTDSEIDQICAKECADLKSRAMKKLGLDEDQVAEAAPISFDGYSYENIGSEYKAQKGEDNKYRSSNYKATMFLFSAEQVYCYEYTFSIIVDEKKETTEEYFYRDIVSAATATDTKKYDYKVGKKSESFSITTEYFRLTVPGAQIHAYIRDMSTAERSINAMKSLLRSKKQQKS